ncbi:branched-chain amino acid ABC transporter permease [Candidatus Cryosericum odellii]|jgi:branched-chain amino acid transport system permease protein|uniref:Branched-chain amino acid ABC transporter permease n=1 Tax=Candidatus Cryosericum odellii TaxID=2290917 RepID=A0A398D6A2_9BACT|nr:branched-chain amino acid ABC transporter permease [Candidatus Cryosericum odellii]RIE10812.1 branched-chain amino acid ABC transporter permease [Candidatus Cryosericum odellii]
MYVIQQLINILQLGSIYGLIALGYTMVYGIMRLINFAHGDLFMVAGFLSFILAAYFKFPFLPTLLICMVVVAMMGVLIERLAYKPLRKAPRVSVVITALGIGLFLENFVLLFYPYPQNVPTLIPRITWNIGGATISYLQVLIIGLALFLMLTLDLIVNHTMVGMAMRAISWNRVVVGLMGVPVDRVISITFALGTGLGAVAGVMYSQAFSVIDPYMGIVIGWQAFICAVIGGIGNIRGAILGAYILAAAQILVVMVMPSTYRDVVTFTLLLVFLAFRPYGILGKPAVEKV